MQLMDQANRWAAHRHLEGRLHYCVANAAISLPTLLATYPGPVQLVCVQVGGEGVGTGLIFMSWTDKCIIAPTLNHKYSYETPQTTLALTHSSSRLPHPTPTPCSTPIRTSAVSATLCTASLSRA